MNKSNGKNKKEPNIEIHLPTFDEIEQVIANLNLNEPSAVWLSRALPALAERVKQAITRGDHNVAELRKEQVAFLRSLKKHLMKARALVAQRDDTTFEDVLASEIGLLLSTWSFQTALRVELGVETVRDRDFREFEDSRAGPYQLLEDHVEAERQFLATHSGRRVFVNAISRLIDRVDKYLEHEAKSRGGSPGSAARRYILLHLIWIHNQLCEFEPDRSQGQFDDLAEQVLSLLGLSTDGLDAAVRRLLRPARSRNPTRK